MPLAAMAQNTISGTVSDAADGSPMVGVFVRVENADAAVSTDSEGRYRIAAKDGDVLIYSFLGKTEERRTVAGGVG